MPFAVAMSKVTPPTPAGLSSDIVKVKLAVPELPSAWLMSLIDNCGSALTVIVTVAAADVPAVLVAV
ncbi:hypothetical protein D9M72_592480 [compost metagenome]